MSQNFHEMVWIWPWILVRAVSQDGTFAANVAACDPEVRATGQLAVSPSVASDRSLTSSTNVLDFISEEKGNTVVLCANHNSFPVHCVFCEIQFNVGHLPNHLVSEKYLKNTDRGMALFGSTDAISLKGNLLPAIPAGYVFLECFSIAGKLVGAVAVPGGATWRLVAGTVALRLPGYRAIPPSNACFLFASQLEGEILTVYRSVTTNPKTSSFCMNMLHTSSRSSSSCSSTSHSSSSVSSTRIRT